MGRPRSIIPLVNSDGRRHLRIYPETGVGTRPRPAKIYLKAKDDRAARSAGHPLTFAELNMWFLISGMVAPGSSY